MKYYAWNSEKNKQLKKERGVSFEDVVFHIEAGDEVDIFEHPNQERYPGQKISVVLIEGYAYLVPFVESEEDIFLKTIIPSHKATRQYIGSQVSKLSKEEKEILDAFEEGKLKRVKNQHRELSSHRKAAAATFAKDSEINRSWMLRLPPISGNSASDNHMPTAEDIEHLIAGGETLAVEFKGEERSPLNDRELVEAVVCLANRSSAEPAWLLVGVEDDARVTGSRPRHGNTTEVDRLAALIAARTRPPLTVSIECVRLGDKSVLVIEVPAQHQPVATSEGVFQRRALGGDGRPACVPMDVSAMQSLQADRGLLDPSAQRIADARWEDLDPLEFERFRRSVRERRGRSDESLIELPDLELAKALGVVEANGDVRGLRLTALLLFGKEETLRRFVPIHEAAFQVLRGQEVEVNDFFRWPLLRVMEEIEARIRARNREQELMVGLLRVGVPDYSERALREAVANAFIHRDYQRLGAVHFQWHPDRIEISNPGGFPEGVRLDNLLVTAPRPRNPLLADAFKRAGIVERTARGIDTIFYEQLRNGRPAPSYARSNATGVVVSMPGGEANLKFVCLLVTEAQSGRVLGLDEMLVLNALWQERSLTTDDAARLIQKPDAETRATLHRLVEAGLIEERGQKKGRTWHLSSSAYRALGDKAGYVRQRGFEPLQQEQMVLQYVEKHRRITRKEAAELCRIGPFQATRLLDRLVKDGRLLRHGERKGAWYERGAKI